MYFMRILLLLKFTYFASTTFSESQYCIVETESGLVRGRSNRTLFENRLYYSFRGIQYAKPPINELRFKAPEKNLPWNGIFDAFDFGEDCIQPVSEKNENYFGSENCLNLNVYVPSDCDALNSGHKLPVIVYIFGGRLVFGSGQQYGPDFFMEKDVIIVTFNYRLGPFGFLSLKLPEYSGNMGMKDQTMALEWVNENIEQFGGDKNRITLMGHSSGGVSVNLHMISPKSKHLFQKAVLMSGSALDPLMPTRGEHSTILFNLAKDLNYSASNKADLVNFLNQVDAITFLNRTFRPFYIPVLGRKTFDRVWNVIIEDRNAIDPFLTEVPFNTLTSANYEGHIDALYSFSPKELTAHREQINATLLRAFDNTFEIELPLEMARVNFTSKVYKEIALKIRNFYFDGTNVTSDKLGMLLSDVVFLYGINLSARIQATHSKARTYYTEFSVLNEWNFSERYAAQKNYTVDYSQHFDQLFYMFRLSTEPKLVSDESYRNLTKNTQQRRIIDEVVDFYANFAKYSNPMIDRSSLKVSGSSQLNCYEITNDGIFAKDNPSHIDRIKFWNRVFDDYKTIWNTTFNFQFI